MTDQELLKAMEKMLIESEKRMEKVMDQKLEPIKEDLAEVRSGVNTLLDWAERTGNSIDFPLPKIM